MSQTPINNATITTNGSATYQNDATFVPVMQLSVVLANAPTGTSPTITFTVSVSDDNVNFQTLYTKQYSAQQATADLKLIEPVFAEFVKIAWVVGGTTPSFGGVTVKLNGSPIYNIG